MTHEQKAEVERAADNINEILSVYASYYAHIVAGMQHVIENPGEFGLVDREWKEDAIHNADTGVEIAAERDKYREALERVLQLLKARRPHTPGLGAPINIIKEALKQEDER